MLCVHMYTVSATAIIIIENKLFFCIYKHACKNEEAIVMVTLGTS